MKFKSLQINVLALLFGFLAFCFVNKTEANNAIISPEGQPFSEQNGDNQNQKSTKRGNAAATLSWDFQGPIDASGKTTAVVHSSSNYDLIYVGAAHNGVWKSTDGGRKDWNKISVEGNKNLYVTCLALDEASNALYAGTGGDFTGQGIYKAEGNGSLKLMPGTEGWTNVYKIAISNSRVYAATSSGLMCYTGGKWEVCTGTKNDNTVTFDKPVKDVSVNKAGLVIIGVNSGMQYVEKECYVSKTGEHNKFQYAVLSKDNDMWKAHNIAVAASHADNNILYAVSANETDGKVFKAFLSEDQGDTWEVILEWFSGSAFIDPLEGNGKNINNIYADPFDPYTLYVASRNIWKGKRYAPGPYDFGLSAITMSNIPAADEYYLHSNVRSISFYASYGEFARMAYVATDGGIYRVDMYISPQLNITRTYPAHRFLTIGSYNHVSANNKRNILLGTPTLGVQAIDAFTSFNESARSLWDLSPAAELHISEGVGGVCATSLINEDFYVYSLSLNDVGLTYRRSVDNGKSFQPLREGGLPVEWFASDMITPAPKYDAPMVMWENFEDYFTHDTVWFKADTTSNFNIGDRTIFAPSKNFKYPIEYTVPYGFAHGDSIQVPDPVQNRMFIGLNQKMFMTREALNFSKTPIEWFALPALDSRDTTAAFALSDDANTLYVGTKTGNVWRITNLKQVYNKATIALAERNLVYAFENKKVCAIAVDPMNENHVVVVLEGGGDNVYETTNGGSESAVFKSIKGDLPNNVYTVLFPKGAKTGTIMLGTEKGIWMNEGSGWVANNNGLGEVPVMTLTQLSTYRPGVRNVPVINENGDKVKINYPSNNKTYLTIYAGTYGSGIFSSSAYVGIDDIDDTTAKESDALTVFPNPVTDLTTIDLDMTKGRATIQIFTIDGRLINEQTANNSVNTINFKGYAPGTYIIQVNQGGVVKSAKVIKQ